MKSYELRRNAGKRGGPPDFERTANVVAPNVRAAALRAHAQLERLNIKHALIGGLAVGAHGAPRTTDDVDFLVSDDAFEHHGLIVSFRSGVPIGIGSVRIDYLCDELILALVAETESMPIVDAPSLIALKLLAGRAKDEADIVALCEHAPTAQAALAFVHKEYPEREQYLRTLIRRAEQGK